MKRLILTLVAVLAILLTGSASVNAHNDKVTLCHAAGQDGTTHFITLEVGWNAAYGPAGHFYENGTPRAGHEQDYLGACVEPSPSPTVTPTSSPSPQPTSSPVASESPSPSPTTSPTPSPVTSPSVEPTASPSQPATSSTPQPSTVPSSIRPTMPPTDTDSPTTGYDERAPGWAWVLIAACFAGIILFNLRHPRRN